MLVYNLVPAILNRACQKSLRKRGSQSLTMELGIPCNLKICSKNNWANPLAVIGWLRGKQCEYLLHLSVTTQIISFPLEFGSPVMKSIAMSLHGTIGIERLQQSWGFYRLMFRALAYLTLKNPTSDILFYSLPIEKLFNPF